MNVHDYAQAMKKAAEALRDIDKPVAESEMVLNFITNADPRYNTTREIIASEAGMTFSKVVDRLALQELRLANQTKVAASSTLVASSSGCGPSCLSATSSPSPPQQHQQQQQRPL